MVTEVIGVSQGPVVLRGQPDLYSNDDKPSCFLPQQTLHDEDVVIPTASYRQNHSSRSCFLRRSTRRLVHQTTTFSSVPRALLPHPSRSPARRHGVANPVHAWGGGVTTQVMTSRLQDCLDLRGHSLIPHDHLYRQHHGHFYYQLLLLLFFSSSFHPSDCYVYYT